MGTWRENAETRQGLEREEHNKKARRGKWELGGKTTRRDKGVEREEN